MQPVDYHQVSSAMGVSEEQTKQLLATRRDYLSSVRELLTDRQAIFRQLQVISASFVLLAAARNFVLFQTPEHSYLLADIAETACALKTDTDKRYQIFSIRRLQSLLFRSFQPLVLQEILEEDDHESSAQKAPPSGAAISSVGCSVLCHVLYMNALVSGDQACCRDL